MDYTEKLGKGHEKVGKFFSDVNIVDERYMVVNMKVGRRHEHRIFHEEQLTIFLGCTEARTTCNVLLGCLQNSK